MKLILATCPQNQAKQLAKTLVESKLVACINLIPNIMSMYSWDGALVEDTEAVLLMKTSTESVDALKEAFHKAHPYDVPEFLTVDVNEGASSQSYVAWVNQMTQRSRAE